MDFKPQLGSLGSLSGIAADALLLIVQADDTPAEVSAEGAASTALPQGLDPVVAGLIEDAVSSGDLQCKPGRTFYLHRPVGLKAARLLVSVGKPSVKGFKAAVSAGVAALKSGGARHVAVAICDTSPVQAAHAEALVAAATDAVYLYRHTKPSAPPAPAFTQFTLVCPKDEAKRVQQALSRGQAIAEGVALARHCANLPGNHCTPTYLGEQARELGKRHGLKVEVLDRKAVEKLGMGAFLAVAQGSEEPLRFIVARYDGAGKNKPPLVLVGKGITFDTGGISIKPSAEMDEMKYDMGGAASVLGVLAAVARLKPRLNLVVLIPSCDNMPSGRAVKPGDVVTSMSGQTIEILNTDAEGRLILCDALTYAERFKPSLVVDVATLTGACVVALGHHRSGLFTPDEELARQLLDAGQAALDPCWRMPLDEEYDEGLKSNFADMGNVGPRAGGAITAAMFLKRYTSKYRWAHLDIAGTAWKSGAAKGATGRPVALLTHFVLSHAD